MGKYLKPKNILSIWYVQRKRFPGGKLMKHKDRLFAHGEMKKWGLNYWEKFPQW